MITKNERVNAVGGFRVCEGVCLCNCEVVVSAAVLLLLTESSWMPSSFDLYVYHVNFVKTVRRTMAALLLNTVSHGLSL